MREKTDDGIQSNVVRCQKSSGSGWNKFIFNQIKKYEKLTPAKQNENLTKKNMKIPT